MDLLGQTSSPVFRKPRAESVCALSCRWIRTRSSGVKPRSSADATRGQTTLRKVGETEKVREHPSCQMLDSQKGNVVFESDRLRPYVVYAEKSELV